MVEWHIDERPGSTLLTRINNLCLYGGNLSVRKMPNERPVISFRHDNIFFHQFLFTYSAWKRTKGEQMPIPKDEGYGLMVSAFQSQELRLAMKLTSDQLLRINAFWNEERPSYTEVE
jgi:hypothetical protein